MSPLLHRWALPNSNVAHVTDSLQFTSVSRGRCCTLSIYARSTARYNYCQYSNYKYHSCIVHLDIIKSVIYPTECTNRFSWKNVKTYITIYIKMLLHVSVTQPASGSLLLCFAEVIVLKIVTFNCCSYTVQTLFIFTFT